MNNKYQYDIEFEMQWFYGGIYENSIIQNMAMHLGSITNPPGIDYVHKVF